MIRDTSFKDIVEYKKYKDVYNFRSIEGIASLVFSVLITITLAIVLKQSGIDDINTIIRSLTIGIALAIIGLLGFVVTGLAILTSAISNKIMNIIAKRDKVITIKKILLSFYLLGFVAGCVILLSLFCYIISFLNVPVDILLLTITTFILSYLIVFIIFYAIALVGNCIQIFEIINTIDESPEVNLSTEDRNIYNSFRITSLEKVLFLYSEHSAAKKIEEYKKLLSELIDGGCKDELQKQRLKSHMDRCFWNL